MYKYAKIDQNIPCGSRVISIFTKGPRPSEMILCKASSPLCIPVAGYVKINMYVLLIQIYHVVHEL